MSRAGPMAADRLEKIPPMRRTFPAGPLQIVLRCILWLTGDDDKGSEVMIGNRDSVSSDSDIGYGFQSIDQDVISRRAR
jgi:hypothetical protein